jgi:hypothetical protein
MIQAKNHCAAKEASEHYQYRHNEQRSPEMHSGTTMV